MGARGNKRRSESLCLGQWFPTLATKEIARSGTGSGVWSIGLDGVGGVVFAELVFVGGQSTGDIHSNRSEVCLRRRDVYMAGEILEFFEIGSLGPDVQLIIAWRDAVQRDHATGAGDREIRSTQRNDDGAHLGMNIAKEVRDAFMVEVNDSGASSFVEPQVEALSIELRKYVVKERIEIGEFDAAAQGHDEQMRVEVLVLLLHAKMPGSYGRVNGRPGYSGVGREPENNVAVIERLLGLALE